jgi:hypothetical protein
MAPDVLVSEESIRVHFGHGSNKVVVFRVQAAELRGAERMRLRPVGSPAEGEHDFLELFEEILIAHWASIGPIKKARRRMNKECGSLRGRKWGWRRGLCLLVLDETDPAGLSAATWTHPNVIGF